MTQSTSQKRRIRHVSRNSGANIVSLPWRGGCAGRTGPTSRPITEQEAHAIAVDAYIYFYPLMSMDITRKQFTNIEPGKEFARAR